VWGKDNGRAHRLDHTTARPSLEGGFRFNGRWSFSTGSKHCDWLFLGGLLPKRDGTPGLEHVTFLVPKADYRIEDNWDVLACAAQAVRTSWWKTRLSRTSHPVHQRPQRCGLPRPHGKHQLAVPHPFTHVFQRAVSTACLGAWKPSRRSPSARRRTLESMATGWPRT
jgi:3-hydroxy-9,10-secoandrosta-1,3,5(10)-triene-9,17-dione monooxygenase